MSEQLNRKKQVRAGHQVSATRMKNRIDELLGGAEPPDTPTLAQFGEKLDVLKTLDSEVLELTDEEGLAGEIEDAEVISIE